ncbi:MAG: hypothetical protein ACRELY_19930 [Polyangiaceae bacterium]
MSEEKKPKRSLKLMNEVLPDPRLAREGRDKRPRERTIEHMKRLLALTAGATAVAACSKGYAVVDPMPIPATATIGPPLGPPDAGPDQDAAFGPPASSAGGDMNLGTTDAGPADAGARDAGAKKKKATAPVPTRGYMVVDPLPPPPPGGRGSKP